MPKIYVEIEWDNPKDKHWEDPKNIERALLAVVKDAGFKVREILVSPWDIKYADEPEDNSTIAESMTKFFSERTPTPYLR